MKLNIALSNFLKTMLTKHNLTLKQFSNKSFIPFHTGRNYYQALKINPEFKNVIIIADFFQCSTDEVLGRDARYFIKNNKAYRKLEIAEINNNLKEFIHTFTVKSNISLSRLSLNLGLNSNLLANLFHKDPRIKTLSTLSICKIADYFDVSIDEIIGRRSTDF